MLTVASSDDVAALIEQFRQLRRRRLVILGGAGAGKTTLAVQILLQLLAERGERPDDPVPVLLPLAGWSAEAYDGDLRDWIADRIIAGYPHLGAAGYGAHVVNALVAQGHILPILDGLDEAAPEVRETFVQAVHRSIDGNTQLILTSRTDEFGAVVAVGGRVLSSAVVIQPEPLTASAAAEYLRRCLGPVPGQAWCEVLRRLSDPAAPCGAVAALAEVASNPLGLWLIRATYTSPATDPSPLLDDKRFATAAALRAHLFDQLVGASIAARPPSSDPAQLFRPRHEYDPAQAEDWLRFLAQNLDRWGTREFDWARDPAALAAPFRRSTAVAGFLRRAVPVLAGLLDRYAETRPGIQSAAAVLVLVSLCGLGLLSSLSALFVLLVAGVVALCVRVFVLNGEYAQDGAVDWEAAVDHDWYAVREFFVGVASGALFALAYAVLVGGLAALVTELLLHNGWGGPVGLAVAAVVAVIAYAVYDRHLPPGSRGRSSWYGIGPGPGLRSGIFWGVVVGTIGAVLLTVLYTDSSGGMFWFFFGITAPVSCGFLVLVRAAVVPACHSLAALCAAGVRVAFQRVAGTGDDGALALWRAEKVGQVLRFCRVAVVTVLVALAAGILCRIVRGSAAWATLRQDGVVDWLASHLADFDLTWSGRLRYGFAVLIAWLVTVVRSRLHRGLLSWGLWLLVAVLVVGVWPREWSADDFRLHLSARFDDLDATFSLDAFARFAEDTSSGRTGKTVDVAAVLTDSDLLVPFLGWLCLLGLLVVNTLFGRIERGYSRAWWIGWLTTRWHVARGRLPHDLVVFLDDAHRLGLLRAVGPVYQFRHAEFQDHLARSGTAD